MIYRIPQRKQTKQTNKQNHESGHHESGHHESGFKAQRYAQVIIPYRCDSSYRDGVGVVDSLTILNAYTWVRPLRGCRSKYPRGLSQ